MTDNVNDEQKEVVQAATATVDVATAAEKVEKKATSSVITFGMAVAVSFFVSAMTVGGGLVAYDHFMAPKIVSVDLKGHVADLRDLFIAGKITAEQVEQGIVDAEKIVKGLPENRIVVMGDAFIRGVEQVPLTLPKAKQDAADKQ